MKPALLAICAFLAVSTADGAEPTFAPPAFYGGDYCMGNETGSDWYYSGTQDDVSIYPFSGPEWFNWFAIGACLRTGDGYVKLVLDETMCPSRANEVLKMMIWNYNYYGCTGTPASVTTLTVGTCVKTSIGSAQFNPGVTTDELCTMTNFRTAMVTGGPRAQSWLGDSCNNGLPVNNEVLNMPGGDQPCGARPLCTGCCPLYNLQTCDRVPNVFNYAMTACKNLGGGKWDMAMANLIYSDDKCTVSLDSASPLLGHPFVLGGCNTFEVQSVATASTMLSLEAPLTTDIYCKYVELNTNRSVGGFLKWDKFNELTASGASTSAHPAVSVLGLALLFVTVLLF
eukprot:TRINITY_DN9139_c0_g1_i2.p1 TRINITY_DN9139_c0_g1~~TRINITY_DN9139_c0_g1_i2.p1  ORF type:complete len:341 (+),score=70.04 TRINITY_DN9139_c0_g1_i2:53-1075(+)